MLKKFSKLFLVFLCTCNLGLYAGDIDEFVEVAKQQLGSPYVYGSAGPRTFDCSGLVYYSAKEALNLELPRSSKSLYSYCKKVDDNDMKIGDLLFFKTLSSSNISHVGIYLGNRQFISALSEGSNKGVNISSLDSSYWSPRFVSAGRIKESSKPSVSSEKVAENKVEEPKEKTSSNRLITASDRSPTSQKKVKELDPKKRKSQPEYDDSDDEELETSSKLWRNQKKNEIKDSNGYGWTFDASVYGGWSFMNYKKLGFEFKDIETLLSISYVNKYVTPGLGSVAKLNFANGMLEFPIFLSLGFCDNYIKVYGGVVPTFDNGEMGEKSIRCCKKLPLITGVTFSTPQLKLGKVRVSLVQDISFTMYEYSDGTRFTFRESIGNGLIFNTGLKIAIPL